MEEKEVLPQKSSEDNNQRKVFFEENFLRFEEKIFEKGNIKDYRFGIRWISFKLTYGREYQIFVRDKENNVMKIGFKSYFGRKLNQHEQLYTEVLQQLWSYSFSEIVDNYLEKYRNSETFTVGDVLFTKDHIQISVSGILQQTRATISWENIRTKNYARYFSVYSSENPSAINRGYSYKDDWNTNVLYSVLRTILKSKNIESY